MGRHTRTQDRDLGAAVTTFPTLRPTDLPTIHAMRQVVRAYDRAMLYLGLDPEDHQDEAHLVLTPGYRNTYRVAGWILEAGPRG